MKYQTDVNESELRCIERELAAKLKVPYVRCAYDTECSHKTGLTDELSYRRKEEILGENEYVINYEMYNTKEDYDKGKCSIDGTVHELIYTVTKDNYISVKS